MCTTLLKKSSNLNILFKNNECALTNVLSHVKIFKAEILTIATTERIFLFGILEVPWKGHSRSYGFCLLQQKMGTFIKS